MAVRNNTVLSLLDVVSGKNPDGSSAKIAEVLQRSNAIMDDMSWMEGNLETGHRTHVRTKNAKSTYRRFNQGILPSKGAVRAKDETAALQESRQSVDRALAIKSGNPAVFREQQGIPHIQGMHNDFMDVLMYGNEYADDTVFTGFMPRFNELANEQVIDAGGTGANLRSILLVGWSQTTVTGIVPKNGHTGLQHLDTTANRNIAPDGYPVGDEVEDGITPGATYMAYSDRWIWEQGLAIPDPRYVVRIANIDLDTLELDPGTDGGAMLEDLMIQAEERFGAGSDPYANVNAAFYMPRELSTWARRQNAQAKRSTNFSWQEVGGRRVTAFGETPVRRVDAMNVDEARVV